MALPAEVDVLLFHVWQQSMVENENLVNLHVSDILLSLKHSFICSLVSSDLLLCELPIHHFLKFFCWVFAICYKSSLLITDIYLLLI